MLHDNASHDNDGNGISQVYAINTDGVFMTNRKKPISQQKGCRIHSRRYRTNISD